jgi:peptidyl-prolyl cis-trans isomerase A (cyclophilin A)
VLLNRKIYRRSHESASLAARAKLSLIEPLEGRCLMDGTLVRFSTSIGNVDMQLLDQQTQLTVTNFLNYVTSGRYDGTIFHRSIPGFIVQGGGYNVSNLAKTITQDTNDSSVPNEPHGGNVRGTVALAKEGGAPDSGKSEFFFNLADNTQNLDNQNGGFTVFGDVVGNTMPVVDNVATLPTYSIESSPFTDLPLENFNPANQIQASNLVVVKKAEVVQATDVTLASGKAVTFADADGTNTTLAVTGGAATLHFTGTSISQSTGAKGVTVSGSAVSLDSLTFTGHGPKITINVTGKGGDNAVRVGPIAINRNVNLTVNSTGAALALDTISLTGSTAATSIKVTRANNKGIVELDEVTADGPLGSVTGPINLAIGLNTSGMAKTINVASLSAATVTAPAIGTLTAPSIANSTISTTTSIGSVSATSIAGSRISAGVPSLNSTTTTAVLPQAPEDFVTNGVIGSINATTFSNSAIAASTVGSANLGTVPLNAKKPTFGIGAKQIKSLSFNHTHLTNLNSPAAVKAKKLKTKNFQIDVIR